MQWWFNVSVVLVLVVVVDSLIHPVADFDHQLIAATTTTTTMHTLATIVGHVMVFVNEENKQTNKP